AICRERAAREIPRQRRTISAFAAFASNKDLEIWCVAGSQAWTPPGQRVKSYLLTALFLATFSLRLSCTFFRRFYEHGSVISWACHGMRGRMVPHSRGQRRCGRSLGCAGALCPICVAFPSALSG